MPRTKYLLIGGGLAASQAAKQLRERGDGGDITLVSTEPHVPYDRPPLSKEFLRGEKPRAALFYEPEQTLRGAGVELILETTVQELDLATKHARLSNGTSLEFDKALLATGGRPVRLDIPGGDLDGIHYLRTVDDAEGLAAAARPDRRAVIVGAGFIGMEAAASLAQRGVSVTVLEAAPRVWARFADETLAGFFQDYCSARGVQFHTGVAVTAFVGEKSISAVRTKTEDEFPCDFVLVAVGIHPNDGLAAEAGLEVADGIVVDEHLQTSHPDVFAAGDVVRYPDPYFHKHRRVEHWGHAEYSGQVAGQNMAGADTSYTLLTYVWSDVFDLHLEFAGDETEHDDAVVRGRLEDGTFTVLYLRDHRLTAYFSVNGQPREFGQLQKLIRKGIDLEGQAARLADPEVSLKEVRGEK